MVVVVIRVWGAVVVVGVLVVMVVRVLSAAMLVPMTGLNTGRSIDFKTEKCYSAIWIWSVLVKLNTETDLYSRKHMITARTATECSTE